MINTKVVHTLLEEQPSFSIIWQINWIPYVERFRNNSGNSGTIIVSQIAKHNVAEVGAEGVPIAVPFFLRK